jgi:hypothetical protein
MNGREGTQTTADGRLPYRRPEISSLGTVAEVTALYSQGNDGSYGPGPVPGGSVPE